MKEVGALKSTISKLSSVVCKPIKEYLFFYSFCVFASMSIGVCSLLLGMEYSIWKNFIYILAEGYIVCVLALLCKRFRIDIIVMAVTILLFATELCTIFIYRTTFSVSSVQLVLDTNVNESKEFLLGAINNTNTYLALIPLGVVVSIALLVCWTRKHIAPPKIIVIIMVGLIVWSFTRNVSEYRRLNKYFHMNVVEQCSERLPHLATPVSRLLYGIAMYRMNAKEIICLAESVKNIHIEGQEGGCPLIVLVIGESHSKHHTQLFTPDYLPTSPCLSALKEDGNIVIYDDAVSAWNITTNSFKYIFSTWDDMCQDSWINHTLFTALFKQAGYRVIFHTNQFVDTSKNDFDVIGGSIFNHAELSDMQFSERNAQSYVYDMELVERLPQIDTTATSPTLLIVHLMGQHSQYVARYPSDYDYFCAMDERTAFGGEKGKKMSAEYDNATLYNDAVVSAIFKRIQHLDAIGIYTSDHGEEIYDWRDFFCRSSENVMSPEIAHYQYEVPLMFYMTDIFMQKHGEVAEQIREASDRPVILTDISNVMLHLGGIKTKEYREETDFISDKYKMPRKRMLRDRYDYDELMNNKE